MIVTKTDTLRVPGATLYYELHGSGPVLLLIAAGAGDADSYRSMVDYLVGRFTVITYDRRGFMRSPVDDANQTIEIGMHSDDAYQLLAMSGGEPGYVLGCSIGALIGLDLAIHHPEQVKALVAHEPPIPALLSQAERDEIKRDQEKIAELYRQEGPTAAIKQFAANIGVSHNDQNVTLGMPQKNAAVAEYDRMAFFKNDTGAVARYSLDLAALEAAPTRIIPAAGSEGKQSFAYHSAIALASRLGISVVDFPGTHAGFVDYPKEFADRLIDVLSGR